VSINDHYVSVDVHFSSFLKGAFYVLSVMWFMADWHQIPCQCIICDATYDKVPNCAF